MGLIKAALGAAGGVLADQWKEYFYCDSMSAEVLMCKGKKLGAYLGMAFGVLSIAYDIIYHKINGYYRELPLEYICVPLIIYYIYCLIAINTANTGAYDTKSTHIKSNQEKMDTLDVRFWSNK